MANGSLLLYLGLHQFVGCKITQLRNLISPPVRVQFSVNYEHYYSLTCVWEQGAAAAAAAATAAATTFTTITTTTTTTTTTNSSSHTTATNKATIPLLHCSLLYVLLIFSGSKCVQFNIDNDIYVSNTN